MMKKTKKKKKKNKNKNKKKKNKKKKKQEQERWDHDEIMNKLDLSTTARTTHGAAGGATKTT